MKALLGKKVGMTQIFDASGNVVPVTVIEAGPCVVTQIKQPDRDGYLAVQLGFGAAKKPGKSLVGHSKKAGTTPKYMKEIRLPALPEGEAALKVGTKLEASIFEVGDKVQVSGTSKGKGFAGTIKRHNFHTGPKTHGSHNYRAPGSIGSGYPQHVFKGMKMAGQMGHSQVTTKNLTVALVDPKLGVIGLRGAVPGPRKGLVVVRGL
ncbi:MAG TPA: 50S ribosomal protein L3 [Candidatus Saccharimonadales bacterium]|nr:50S ribosomal protein L3 [Candidatus Saccharimonadales bacterium]